MKWFIQKVVIALVVLSPWTASAKASSVSEINERDIQAIAEYVRVQDYGALADKDSELNLSGDIRFEYKYLTEEFDEDGAPAKIDVRGNEISPPLAGSSEVDVEFNLYFDYTGEVTWAHGHIEFDNCAGISHTCNNDTCGSGTYDGICLRAASFGYNLFLKDTSRFDIEMGRWDMYALFDSRVQFQHRFDGALFTYSNSFEDVADFYIKAGAFVIDTVASNWGYAAELGLVDILDIGLDVKCSFTDYVKRADRMGQTYNPTAQTAYSPCVRGWSARVSQLSVAYHFNPEFLDKDVKLYGAILFNYSAREEGTPEGVGKENYAYYIGMMIGGIQGEGDWAFDGNWQSVQAQAVPDFAVSGIGTGNIYGNCYHSVDTFTALGGAGNGGNTNYQGIQLEGAYAVTDNLTVIGEFAYSSAYEKKAWGMNNGSPAATTGIWVGGGSYDVHYMKFEVECMYAF